MNDAIARFEDGGPSGVSPKTERVVELKSGGPGPCLFIVPGLGGKVDGLVNFGALLQTPMRAFGSAARGVEGESPPHTEMTEIVQHNLMLLKSVQANGPYYLLGHSFGGIVAFEMARRLVESSEKVACLILLDTPISQKYWPIGYYLKDLLSRARRHATNMWVLPPDKKMTYLWENSAKFVRKFYDPYGLRRTGINVMVGDRMAGDAYFPGFYPEKLIFFRATIKEMPADPNALWRSRVRELEIHMVRGGHNSMLDPPYVAALAKDVSACLGRASVAVQLSSGSNTTPTANPGL